MRNLALLTLLPLAACATTGPLPPAEARTYLAWAATATLLTDAVDA